MPDFPRALPAEVREKIEQTWRRSKTGVYGFWIAIASLIVAITAIIVAILY